MKTPNSESVRTALIDSEPFFVGKDVAAVLGYTNPLKAVRDHVDEDDKGVNESFTPEGGTQKTIFINESGLYSMILSSKLPAAKKFKRWVTSEVLPAIRKTGSYTAPAPKSDRELSIEEAKILESLIPLCPVDTCARNGKQVKSFVYYEDTVDIIRELLGSAA